MANLDNRSEALRLEQLPDCACLDWYTVSMAVFATVILAAHGATYLVLKDGRPSTRSQCKVGKVSRAAAVPLFVVVSIESWLGTPRPRWARDPRSILLGSLILVGSMFALASGISAQREMRTFLGSNALLMGLLVTGAAALFPVMLYRPLRVKTR
jgi:cytochrome bd-type quinol oxidase subunit 2